MKFKYLMVITSLFITACDDDSSTIEVELVEVYIHKGDTQCNDDGLTLSETATYLTDSSIDVPLSQCAFTTGLDFPSVCGAGTNNIYIHTIPITDLSKAENLGFEALSSLYSEFGYEIVECS
jgi:hypothetical protein